MIRPHMSRRPGAVMAAIVAATAAMVGMTGAAAIVIGSGPITGFSLAIVH